MGSGASSNFSQGGGDLLAATFLIGQAIAAISFPGMFRIYDFHSSRAPRIKQAPSAFAFFGLDDDDDDDVNKDPADYEDLFHVQVGEDTVYLEDPLGCNEVNWTPLHTCCMSFVTVAAGLALIEEHERLGVSLETATLAGPGTFNSHWTALHMACAYGVEPLVERLVKAGADVNTRNSFGYTPILEACHRGYVNIVEMLLSSGKVDLKYIPNEEIAANSPFVTNPPQTPLGEAARGGFQKIVEMILNHGGPKDMQNKLGWTALHEACFFNRVESVKILLLAGCRGDIRSKSGALPYHLASLKMVREMISDMGGPGSTPIDSSDVVDMVHVLRDLTSMGLDDDDSPSMVPAAPSATPDVEAREMGSVPSGLQVAQPKKMKKKRNPSAKDELVAEEKEDEPLLHSGGILGDLPSLGVSPNKSSPDKGTLARHSQAKIDGAESMFSVKGKGRSGAASRTEPPKDVPREFVCELCQKLMSDPVKSVYGNVFEATVINRWIKEQGHICPLTGAPLSEADLTPLDELRDKIQQWVLQKSQKPRNDVGSPQENPSAEKVTMSNKKATVESNENDELYDF